jgi:hypothetical protein
VHLLGGLNPVSAIIFLPSHAMQGIGIDDYAVHIENKSVDII